MSRRLYLSIWPSLQRPIFVIGAARSGTTFLGRCLAILPEISYHFEPVATKMADHYVYQRLWSDAKAARFYRTVYRWLMRVHLDGGLRFADKTPQHCFVMDFLARTFPDAQFIHIIRDGRDAALSLSEQPWLQAKERDSGNYEPGGYAFGPVPRFWVEPHRHEEFRRTSDIHRCIWSWRRHTEAALQSSANLPKNRYFELRYERLVSDPEVHAQDLAAYLGITSESSRRALCEAMGKRRSESVDRWRSVLDDEQLKQINAEAGELLRRLGYT